jgi:hypothetical protein
MHRAPAQQAVNGFPCYDKEDPSQRPARRETVPLGGGEPKASR